MTTTTVTTTDNASDVRTQQMIEKAVGAALAAKGAKTPQEIANENAANRIKANLGGRITRDVQSDASVRTGLRTAMSQSLIAGGALGALGFTEESAMLLAQGEAARFAQRKGLRAEGATGAVRAALSYVPFVGDAFLGGASVQERALYAQTNAAHAQGQAMGEIAMMIQPVAGAIKEFLAAGTVASQAQAELSTAAATATRVNVAQGKLKAQENVRHAENHMNTAKAALDGARNAETVALGEIAKAKAANAAKAVISQAEKDHMDCMTITAQAERSWMETTVIHGQNVAVLLACG